MRNLRIFKLFVFAILALITAVSGNADILVYKWSINGSEYYSQNGDNEQAILRKYSQKGFMVVDYSETLKSYSDSKLVSYWKDPTSKTAYYFDADFLYGIPDFEIIQVIKDNKHSDYLSISAYWGGMLGENYSGIIKPFKASSIGAPDATINIAKSLKGWSSWDKTYTTGATTQGGATVKLSLDNAWSKYANTNKLNVDQTVTEIVAAVKKAGYKEKAPGTVINTPAKGMVDIDGGTIDGTIIGGTDPRDGTFINLKVGHMDKTGQFFLHSGTTGFEALFKTPDNMEEDIEWILPPNSGAPGQVLTTDGKGNLSWTDKGGSGGDINIVNGGTEGVGVFGSKSTPNNDYIFRNIAPGSDKVTVSLNSYNIRVDIEESKIQRGNLSGTQTADTISDFQQAVLQNPNVFLCNTTATTPPSSSDDSTKGYSAGSMWINTTTKMVYLCVDPSPGIATWKDITPSYEDFLKASKNLSDLTDVVAARANLGLGNVQNIKNNYVADREPNASDDANSGYAVGSIWLNSIKGRTFICVRNNPGSAVWQLLTAGLSASIPMKNDNYQNFTNGWY